jgi:hypothetical protein
MRADRFGCALLCVLAGGCLQGVAPYPRDDVATTREDTPLEIDVLANDHDADEVTDIVTPPSLGRATIQDDGTILYEPLPEKTGEDSFTYLVENEAGAAQARVTVHVQVDSDRFGEPSVLLSRGLPLTPIAANLDRDGQADLILQVGDQTLALLAEGDDFREVEAWGEPRCCLRSPPLVADIDGDGDSDIVRFDEEGGLTIHRIERSRSGSGLEIEDHPIAYGGEGGIAIDGLELTFIARPNHLASGDFDGDGAIDLAVVLDDLDAVVLHSDISSGVPARSRLLTQAPVSGLASGDVTGDGRIDLLVSMNGALDIFSFEGDEAIGARIAFSRSNRLRSTGLLVGQLDDDAREELVVIDGEAITVLDVQVVDNTAEVSSSSVASELRYGVLADVLGDERLELVGSRWRFPAIEIWQPAEVQGKNGLEAFADAVLLGYPDGEPAVLPWRGGSRIIVGRYNDDEEQHELVAVPWSAGER